MPAFETLDGGLLGLSDDFAGLFRAIKAGERICGGADVYRQAIDIVDILYLTIIDKEIIGDAMFPEFDISKWSLSGSEAGSENELDWRFETWERRQS